MGKVDGLSLIIIDFYVPMLTPHLSSTETSLQLSENTLFMAMSKETRCSGRIIYIYMCTVQCGGRDGSLLNPCLYPLA
jgi:hypothetical protein